MVDPAARVLVAFSGGPDSTALMLVLRELGYQIHLGHVDHGMRPDSAEDAVHCQRVAARMGLEIELDRTYPVPDSEVTARNARYSILHRFAERSGSDAIATGHTRDDQAETVQMRLERGGFGLGIPPKRGRIVRPIIEASRTQTVEVCEEAGIPFLLDPSNQDLSFTRNRIRQRLSQDPSWTERLIEVGSDAYRRTTEASTRLEQALRTTICLEDGKATMDRRWASSAHAEDLRALLAGVIRKLGVEPHRSSIQQVARILGDTGKQVSLGGGITAWTDASCLHIGPLGSPPSWPETRLAVPGETVWGKWRIGIRAEPFAPEDGPEVIDRDAVGENLWVRSWRPGDRFKPLGCGQKKLQDFFTDLKVPRLERHGVPIVHDGKNIVWVAGFRIADGAKVTARTTRSLQVNCLERGFAVAG